MQPYTISHIKCSSLSKPSRLYNATFIIFIIYKNIIRSLPGLSSKKFWLAISTTSNPRICGKAIIMSAT